MGSDLTGFVRRAIEVYESDHGLAWLALQGAQDHLDSQKSEKTQKGEKKAAKSSMKKTRAALREKLLDVESRPHPPDKPAHALPTEGSESRGRHVEEFAKRQEAHWEDLRLKFALEVLTQYTNEFREHNGEAPLAEEEILREWGGRDAILWSLYDSANGFLGGDFETVIQEFERKSRGQPNVELYLLRKHLDWLDSSAGKIEADGAIPFRDAIPDHLKRYVYEARWCDLHGLHSACASLCGSILQEAIRIKTNGPGFSGLDEAIRCAVEVGLLTPRAEQAADEVRELRNLAAHGDIEFEEKPEDRKRASLPLTRELLDTIFTTKN